MTPQIPTALRRLVRVEYLKRVSRPSLCNAIRRYGQLYGRNEYTAALGRAATGAMLLDTHAYKVDALASKHYQQRYNQLCAISRGLIRSVWLGWATALMQQCAVAPPADRPIPFPDRIHK